MYFNIYDAFFSLNSHQQVNKIHHKNCSVFCLIFINYGSDQCTEYGTYQLQSCFLPLTHIVTVYCSLLNAVSVLSSVQSLTRSKKIFFLKRLSQSRNKAAEVKK